MNRSVHKDTCRIWDRGVCNCGPINAAPESRDAGGAASGQPCKTCGGTGVVDDGEITGVGGVEFSNGPVKCFKNCPACADRSSIQGAPTPPAPSADSDGGANKQDRQLVNQGRDEGMRAAFLAMQEAQTGGAEAVAPEAKPEWPNGAFFTDGDGSFYDEQAEPLPGKESLTLSPPGNYIQTVPDHCDRIIWRGRYWALPIKSIDTPVSPALEAAPADYPPPDILFDSYAVYQALSDKAKARTSAENVADVLDAIVRAQRSGVSADPLPDRVSLSLGPVAFQFTSHQQWVNKAQSWFANLAAENPNAARKRYLCIDAKGRVCMIGKDFGRARDEDAFPVKLYLIDAAQQHQVKKGESS